MRTGETPAARGDSASAIARTRTGRIVLAGSQATVRCVGCPQALNDRSEPAPRLGVLAQQRAQVQRYVGLRIPFGNRGGGTGQLRGIGRSRFVLDQAVLVRDSEGIEKVA